MRLSPEQLDGLLNRLRRDGYLIGVDQYVAVRDLFLALESRGELPDDPRRLASLLAPILCHTPREQREFARHFQAHLETMPQTPEPASSHESGAFVAISKNTPLRVSAMVAMVLLLAPAGFFLMEHLRTITWHGVITNNANEPLAGVRMVLDGQEMAESNGQGQYGFSTKKRHWQEGMELEAVLEHYLTGSHTTGKNPPDGDRLEKLFLLQPVRDEPPPPTEGNETAGTTGGDTQTEDGPQVPDADDPSDVLPDEPEESLSAIVDRINRHAEETRLPVTWKRKILSDWRYSARPILAFLALMLLLRFAWSWQRRRTVLRSRSTRGDPEINRVHVKGNPSVLFDGPKVRRTLQRMGVHRLVGLDRLDMAATANATVRNFGIFTPMTRVHPLSPEYLVLVDRSSFRDQASTLIDSLLARLQDGGIYIHRYYFNGDPRVLQTQDPRAPHISLDRIRHDHAGYRLLLFGDGSGLLNPATGRPRAWLPELEVWPERALFTPAAPNLWGAREFALATTGLKVLPASETGLDAFMQLLHGADQVRIDYETTGPYPRELAGNPLRWLHRGAPEPDRVSAMCRDLRAYLEDDGYTWLCACAVYPAVSWDLTLYLGSRLRNSQGRPLLEEHRLLALTRLPWFRHGHMPDWLRLALLAALPRGREKEIRRVLEDLLRGAGSKQEGFSLDIARNPPSHLFGMPETEDSPLRDHVFLQVMTARKANPLALKAPRLLKRLIYQDGNPHLGPRPTATLLFIMILALTSLVLEPRPVGPSGPGIPVLTMLPAGVFQMGSPEDELGRSNSETLHEVELTQDFAMGIYEVTLGQYQAIFPQSSDLENNLELPKNLVSWEQASQFCRALTQSQREAGLLPEHLEYRLPTEAEWEYAARAGSQSRFGFGDDQAQLVDYAWFMENAGEIQPVGTRESNPWGLYDLQGNLAEWCGDWMGDHPSDSRGDPQGPITGNLRITKGGSAVSSAAFCRAASRVALEPGTIEEHLGFRVVLAPKEKAFEMVMLEPGTFLMGSPPDEPGREFDEIQHEVELTQGFGMGKYEITQRHYEEVMGINPSTHKNPNTPVHDVSWQDAMNFCAELTAQHRKEGKLEPGWEYRLPTEAQWEYAARAGTQTAYSFGNDEQELGGYAWYDQNTDGPKPVGTRKANLWDLYDMHGNVEEWCLDWYGDYDPGKQIDPVGPGEGRDRVFRGGSWGTNARYCRAAYRIGFEPGLRYSNLGFRVALVQVTPSLEEQAQSPRDEGEEKPFEVVMLEPGTFLMGSSPDEPLRYEHETQHEVELTQGFGMGKYEVTQRHYEEVMGNNPSRHKDPNAPVHDVTWQDAMDFCAELTAQHRKERKLEPDWEYRLPTEAQWEYAARAGTQTAYSFGGDQQELDGYAWYDQNTDGPKPVGTRKANLWDLHDMHGNVFEWCLDWYGDYDPGKQIDPVGPGEGRSHVIRGGSWYTLAHYCRAAYRFWYEPGKRLSNLGFRVALVQVPPSLEEQVQSPRDEGEEKPFEVVMLEPGTFLMGSPPDEPGRYENETQHEVELTQGFGMSKYEITQRHYEEVMGINPSTYKNPNAPVHDVSWQGAMDFCAELTAQHRKEGKLEPGWEYRLPTEAQWEYAARAGTKTAYSFGNGEQELGDYAWYDQYNDGPKPVGTRKANLWDLYDMHGNVDEWCLDWYGDYDPGKQIDPVGTGEGRFRVIRGGSYFTNARYCRAAYRFGVEPVEANPILGFRVALVQVLPEPMKK